MKRWWRNFSARCWLHRLNFGRLPKVWDWRSWAVLFFPKLDSKLSPRYIPPVVAEHESVQEKVGWKRETRNIPGYMSADYMRQVLGMVKREQDILVEAAKYLRRHE